MQVDVADSVVVAAVSADAKKEKVRGVRVTLRDGKIVEVVSGRLAYAYGPLVIYTSDGYGSMGWAAGEWLSFEEIGR